MFSVKQLDVYSADAFVKKRCTAESGSLSNETQQGEDRVTGHREKEMDSEWLKVNSVDVCTVFCSLDVMLQQLVRKPVFSKKG